MVKIEKSDLYNKNVNRGFFMSGIFVEREKQ